MFSDIRIIRECSLISLWRFIMDLDLSAISSKLAIVLPYLSYIVNLFTKMFDTVKAFLQS